MLIRQKNKSYGGPSYYTVPGGLHVNMHDMWFMIRDGEDLIFDKCNQDERLIAMLRQAELNFPPKGNNIPDLKGDVDFLNRIIRGGGFIEYIRKLES